jgi:hypothetical protein
MSNKPTGQFAKQVAGFDAGRKYFVDNFVSPEDKNIYKAPFVKNRMARVQNSNARSEAEYENMRNRGNPLSIIANEEAPNPARRMREMNAAKANSKPPKGL